MNKRAVRDCLDDASQGKRSGNTPLNPPEPHCAHDYRFDPFARAILLPAGIVEKICPSVDRWAKYGTSIVDSTVIIVHPNLHSDCLSRCRDGSPLS